MSTPKRELRKYSADDLEWAAVEAFTTGRIYAEGGEKEEPGEIHAKLMANVRRAITRGRKTRAQSRRYSR